MTHPKTHRLMGAGAGAQHPVCTARLPQNPDLPRPLPPLGSPPSAVQRIHTYTHEGRTCVTSVWEATKEWEVTGKCLCISELGVAGRTGQVTKGKESSKAGT